MKLPPPPMSQVSAGEGFDLTAVLRQLGVDPADLEPQTADALAAIVQSVLQGVIDVLRARTQIKSQLRLPAGRVRSTPSRCRSGSDHRRAGRTHCR